MRALAWTGVIVIGATACILNPQPLPPDKAEDGGVPTAGNSRDAGGKLGADAGKNYPPPEDGGAPFEAGGGSGEGGVGEGGEAGELDGGLDGGGDAAGDEGPESGPGDGGKTVDGSAGDAGPG